MHTLNLVAVYEDRAVAEEARHKLMADGIPESDIRVSADAGAGAPGRMTTASREQESGGFLSWLFNLDDVSESDRTWYGHHLEKRTAVSVRIEENEASRVRDILDSCDPVDIGAEPATEHRRSVEAGSGEPPKMSDRTGEDTAPMSLRDGEVLPLLEEPLEGKEPTETRHRVRTYVVERPVERTIPLRDERVERHERPVVDKKAAATEESVVDKKADERPETVPDTLREVDVEEDRRRDDGPSPTVRDDAGRKS